MPAEQVGDVINGLLNKHKITKKELLKTKLTKEQ